MKEVTMDCSEQHFSCRIGRDSFSIDYMCVFHLLWGRKLLEIQVT